MASEQVDDFLAHYGVKGMKWGVTKSDYKSMTKSERKAQKTKNIEEARMRLQSGDNRTRYLKAKANVKIAKGELSKSKANRSPEEVLAKKKAGVAAAKAALRNVKDKNTDDYRSSVSAKNGKELAMSLLLGDLGTAININRDVERMRVGA